MAEFTTGNNQRIQEPSFTNPYASIIRKGAEGLFSGVQKALKDNSDVNSENYDTQRSNITNDLLAQIQSGRLRDLGTLPIGNYDTTALVKSLSDKRRQDETNRANLAKELYRKDSLEQRGNKVTNAEKLATTAKKRMFMEIATKGKAAADYSKNPEAFTREGIQAQITKAARNENSAEVAYWQTMNSLVNSNASSKRNATTIANIKKDLMSNRSNVVERGQKAFTALNIKPQTVDKYNPGGNLAVATGLVEQANGFSDTAGRIFDSLAADISNSVGSPFSKLPPSKQLASDKVLVKNALKATPSTPENEAKRRNLKKQLNTLERINLYPKGSAGWMLQELTRIQNNSM